MPQQAGQGHRDVGGALDDGRSGGHQHPALLGRPSLRSGQEGSRVPEGQSRVVVAEEVPHDHGNEGLGVSAGIQQFGDLELQARSRLAVQHHRLGVVILLEQGQQIGKRGADDGIAADGYRGGDPVPGDGHDVCQIVGIAAGFRKDAYGPALEHSRFVAEHPDLRASGRHDAIGVGPIYAHAGTAGPLASQNVVVQRHAVGDDVHPLGGGAQQIVHRVGVGDGREVGDSGIEANSGHRFDAGVEHRHVLQHCSAAAGRHAADDAGAEGEVDPEVMA